MLRLSGRLALAACAWFVIGCGSTSYEPLGIDVAGSAGSAGAAAVTGPAGGAAGAGGKSANGGSSGQSSVGSGGALSCSAYTDDAGYKLPIHIKNSSSSTLYLGPQDSTCVSEPLFQVQDGARHLLPTLTGCHTSCQALMQTGPVACPLACASPATTTLAPGQTIDVQWDGRYAVSQTLPEQCMAASAAGSSTSCVQAEQIEAAAFTFLAHAGTQRHCLDASGACGSCAANANGTCTTPASTIAGTIITTELFLKLEPGETSASGEPPYIALEFKNAAK